MGLRPSSVYVNTILSRR